MEEEEEKNQMANKERFVPMSNEELNHLELSRNEQTTSRSTSWAVRCFQEYLKSTKQDVDFVTITKEELNRILREFYGSARNSQGQHYSISSYLVVLRKLEAMNPNTPRGLVNKVWFNIHLHFRRRGKEGLRKRLNPSQQNVIQHVGFSKSYVK